MSANTYLVDAAARHAVFVQRFAAGQAKQAQSMLARLRREIAGRLSDEPTQFQYARLRALQIDIDKISKDVFKDLAATTTAIRDDFVISEAEFTKTMLDKASSVPFALPSDEQLIAAAATKAFNVGSEKLTVNQALEQFGRKKAAEVTQMINDGVILGDTTGKISRDVGDKINILYKHQVDALVRTSVNNISSIARDSVYEANKDIIDGYEWVSTLDSRTSFICGGRDGQVFQVGAGPMPPAHWNCRSTTVPKIREEFDLGSAVKGERPSNGSDGVMPVAGTSTYSGWLKRQSSEFQNEALGLERAKLFRSGRVDMTGFVDPTGRTYSLAELSLTHELSIGK